MAYRGCVFSYEYATLVGRVHLEGSARGMLANPLPSAPTRCMAHIRRTMPYYGRSFQVKVPRTFLSCSTFARKRAAQHPPPQLPLASEFGTYKTVRTIFCSWLSFFFHAGRTGKVRTPWATRGSTGRPASNTAASRRELFSTQVVFKSFVLKMAQAKAIIWP